MNVTLNNGVEMPAVGLGTWPYRGEELARTVDEAWQLGYRSFDTAWLYGNETDLGGGRLKSVGRDEWFVTSKLHINNLYLHRYHYRWPNLRVRSVSAAYEASCRRLGVERIDLYLIHWPFPGYLKMWAELTDLYRRGRVRAVGVSSFMPQHLESLKAVSDVVPAVNQVEMNPYNSRGDVVDYCLAHGIVPEAYSPLGRGRRTQQLLADPVLLAIAGECGRTVAQVILRWLVQRGVMVIPRTNKPEKLRQNISIFDFTLTDEQMRRINALNRDDFIKGDSRNVPVDDR